MSKLPHNCLHLTQSNAQYSPSQASTVREQAGFRKGTGTSDKISNIHWIIEKAKQFQENAYFYII